MGSELCYLFVGLPWLMSLQGATSPDLCNWDAEIGNDVVPEARCFHHSMHKRWLLWLTVSLVAEFSYAAQVPGQEKAVLQELYDNFHVRCGRHMYLILYYLTW